MRHNILKFIFAASLLSMTACDDYLDVDTKSEFAEDVVFTKVETTEGMIKGIYHWFGETNSYRTRLISYMGMNTDTEFQSDSKNGGGEGSSGQDKRQSMGVYTQTANLGDGFQSNNGKDPYSLIYGAIEQSNLCIAGIRQYGNPGSNAQMAQLLGEALTLRAFFYFDLIKYWGDVPARFEPLKVETIFMPKTDRAVIYDQILADLAEAAGYLPWAGETTTTSTVERVSKGFAKGLRARIALSAAGKALVRVDRSNARGGDEGRIGYVFEDEAKRNELYAIVRQECADVYNSGKHKMVSNYEQIWKDVMNDVISIGGESIFEIGFGSGRGQHGALIGSYHAAPNKYVQKAISPYVVAAPNFYYDYAQGDTRRDVTITPFKYVVDSKELVVPNPKDGFQDISNVTQFYFGKYRANYRDLAKSGKLENSSTDCGINFPVLRASDIVLMYAEALNELEGPSAALPYLKEVRNRAFKSTDGRLDKISYDINSKEGFLKAIQDERKFEFANELIRKQDLIRWGILKEKLLQTREDLRNLREGLDKYAQVPAMVYYRLKADNETLEIVGLNPTDDITNCTPENGWISTDWTNATTTTNDGPVYRLSDEWIKLSVFQGDPDKRQLLPIVSGLIVESQGTLANDYGY